MSSPLYTILTTCSIAAQIAPFLASGDDESIYALVTDKTKFSKYDWIDVESFELWCAENPLEYNNIEVLSKNTSSPFYSVANSLLRRIALQNTEGAIDLGKPAIYTLFSEWPFVDTTGSAKASLISFGTFPASLADLNPTIDFSLIEIRKVIWNDDGTRRIN